VIERRRGSSLIITLMVLTVLSIIVVAFMQSMTVERMTARSYSNIEQAQLAADAAVAAAEDRIALLFNQYPDSATAWHQLPGGTGTEATVFHFRAEPISTAIASTNLPAATGPAAFNPTGSTNVVHYAWPLVSGAAPVPISSLTNTFPEPLSSTNAVDLNAQGWIGAAPGQTNKVLSAGWIEILRDPTQPRDLSVNPATGERVNPPVARYAFWMEDESFRVNLNVSDEEPRGGDTLGAGPEEIPMLRVLADSLGSASETNNQVLDLAASMVSLRQSLPGARFETAASATYATNGLADLAGQLAFVATVDSSTYNVSRGGYRRPELDALFGADVSQLRQELDRFAVAVTNTSAAPLFGQRFYRSPNTPASSSAFESIINETNRVTDEHTRMYVDKLGANARDYVDEDNQPTLLRNDPLTSSTTFPVVPSGRPTEGIEPLGGGTSGPNPMAAIGQENIPRLQEYAIHGRLLSMDPVGFSGSTSARPAADFEMTIDHYFEFWNPGTVDIVVSDSDPETADLGASAFLKIYNQPSIGDHPNSRGPISPVIPEGREIEVPLSAIRDAATGDQPLRFPAGEVVVITTDPDPNEELLQSGATVYIAPVEPDDREFSGTTLDYSTDNTVGFSTNYTNTYRVLVNFRSNTNNDYESCLLLGNDDGILDSFCALPIVRSGGYAMSLESERPDWIDSDRYFVRGGSLRGNGGTPQGPWSLTGDPRSLNEQLEFLLYQSGGPPDQTRFYNSNLNNNNVPANSTVGTMNDNYVDPGRWVDFTDPSETAASAPAIVSSGELVSIAELGHLHDPARAIGSAPNIELARGGGRTLRIGQPDAWDLTDNRGGLWDGDPLSASRTWPAWRLVDLFASKSDAEIEGAININGIQRDGGLAFESTLTGLRFLSSPDGAEGLAGNLLTEVATEQILDAIGERFEGASATDPGDDRIFWERGEISELSLFNNEPNFQGVNLDQTIDRGREELLRRSLELFCTKGNTYRIYAVGQALQIDANDNVRAVATRQQMTVIKLVSDSITDAEDDFDPSNSAEVEDRFRPISDYEPIRLWTLQE